MHDGFIRHLYNEVLEEPWQSHEMWQGCAESDDIHTFLVDRDGSAHQGLWAETWEDAKKRFLSFYPGAHVEETYVLYYELDEEMEETNKCWHSFLGSDLEN